MKKPFKETKFGKLVIQKIPQVANVVGDLLPDQGVLGIVKNIISTSDLSEEEKAELLKHEKDLFELEVRDRESARNREIEIAKTDKSDWLMNFVCIIVMIQSISITYGVIVLRLDTPAFTELKAWVGPMVIAVIMYYFGASKGGRDFVKHLSNK